MSLFDIEPKCKVPTVFVKDCSPTRNLNWYLVVQISFFICNNKKMKAIIHVNRNLVWIFLQILLGKRNIPIFKLILIWLFFCSRVSQRTMPKVKKCRSHKSKSCKNCTPSRKKPTKSFRANHNWFTYAPTVK